jgi:hypothetical protein
MKISKRILNKIGSINEMLPIVKKTGEFPQIYHNDWAYFIELIKPIEINNGIVYITYSDNRYNFSYGLEKFKPNKIDGGECDFCGHCDDCDYGNSDYLDYHLNAIHNAFKIAIKCSKIKKSNKMKY